jgi:O-acetyl-ADP-ribose deacetylase (regulator of RNase III)
MNQIRQDLLSIDKGFLLHQVNCQGVFNAGLAKAVRAKYPMVLGDYYDHLRRYPGKALGGFASTWVNDNLVIVHCFTQNHYGNDGKRYTDYDAMADCFAAFQFYRYFLSITRDVDLPVYAPFNMGCGYGGGDWAEVCDILETYLPEITICRL